MDTSSRSSIVRSAAELAVSEVGRMARTCVQHLRESAELLGEEDSLRRRFEALAIPHEAIAASMAEASRALGDMPREPDPDRETLERIVRAVKRALSSDERKLLLDERIAEEHQLLAEIDKGLALELEADLRARLAQCREMVEGALQELASPSRAR